MAAQIETTAGFKALPRSNQLGQADVCGVCSQQLACLDRDTNGPVEPGVSAYPTLMSGFFTTIPKPYTKRGVLIVWPEV
jgi:hypothetical protein